MEFPLLENERLEIDNFLALKDCSLELRSFNTLIGQQASGKSIIAKLYYYFRKYLSDLFGAGIESDEDRRLFDKRKINELFELFPGIETDSGAFNIIYRCGELEIRIGKTKKARRPKITLSKYLQSMFSRVKADYKRYINSGKRKPDSWVDDLYEYYHSNSRRTKYYNHIPTTLFIPASRVFFRLSATKFLHSFQLRELSIH